MIFRIFLSILLTLVSLDASAFVRPATRGPEGLFTRQALSSVALWARRPFSLSVIRQRIPATLPKTFGDILREDLLAAHPELASVPPDAWQALGHIAEKHEQWTLIDWISILTTQDNQSRENRLWGLYFYRGRAYAVEGADYITFEFDAIPEINPRAPEMSHRYTAHPNPDAPIWLVWRRLSFQADQPRRILVHGSPKVLDHVRAEVRRAGLKIPVVPLQTDTLSKDAFYHSRALNDGLTDISRHALLVTFEEDQLRKLEKLLAPAQPARARDLATLIVDRAHALIAPTSPLMRRAKELDLPVIEIVKPKLPGQPPHEAAALTERRTIHELPPVRLEIPVPSSRGILLPFLSFFGRFLNGIPDEFIRSGLRVTDMDLHNIESIFSHLFPNAVDAIAATKRGPGTVRAGIFLEGAHIALEIEDDGIGIPADILAKLLEENHLTTKNVLSESFIGRSGIAVKAVRYIAERLHYREIELETYSQQDAKAYKKVVTPDAAPAITPSQRTRQGTLWRILFPAPFRDPTRTIADHAQTSA